MRTPAPIAAKAERLIIANISALLFQQHKSQKALAVWCHNTEAWISAVLKGRRRLMLYDVDRIADFFGLRAYQLFTPGIELVYERRKHDRRSGKDRRIAHRIQELQKAVLQSDLKAHRKTPRPPDIGQKADPRAAQPMDGTTESDVARIESYLQTTEAAIRSLEQPVAPHRRPAPAPRPHEASRRESPARGPRKAVD